MTTWYSEHYNGVTPIVTGTATGNLQPADPPIKRRGIGHAARRMKRSLVDFADIAAPVPASSTCRMFPMKSGDRIYRLFVACPSTWSAVNLTIGCFLAGADHDGAVLDANLYVNLLAITGGILYVDEFTHSGTMEDEDRGVTLWQQIEEGAAQGWTEDPLLDIDIVCTFTGTFTTGAELLVAIEYSAGSALNFVNV